MGRAATFKQVDVERAAKGAKAAGLRVARIEIDRTGKIVIVASAGDKPTAANEWDEVFQ